MKQVLTMHNPWPTLYTGMKKLLVLIIILSTLSGCKTEKETTPSQLENYFKDSNLPAAIMGSVTRDGEIHWKAFGPSVWGGKDTINENNIFRIYSMTKAITSIAAMQLVEKGKIGLDDPLNDLMPEMTSIPILTKDGKLVQGSKSITLRHLLTHTAGFGYDFTSSKLQNFQSDTWEYEDNPRLFEAGTNWCYGTSTDWVGKIVEKISGENLEAYFRNHITGPLQMDATWFNVPDNLKDRIVSYGTKDSTGFHEYPRIPEEPVTSFNAGGGLFGSPKDYLTFLQCMLNYGKYDGGQLLSRASFELMLTDNLPKDVHLNYEQFENDVIGFTGEFFDESDRWGLAWAIKSNDNESIRPTGSVYWAGAANSYYTLDVENKIAVVYFAQYFPFNDKESFDFYRLFEKEVYRDIEK